MKTIKHTIKLFSIIFFMTAFSNCAGSKKLQEKASFALGAAYSQEWVSGVKDGGAGVNLNIPVASLPENITMDSAYFRGMKAPITTTSSGEGMLMVARFKLDINEKRDIISHEDSRMEVGNEPPSVSEELPFKLENNEAVISYISGKKIYYYKVENVKSIPALAYPSAPVKKGF